MVKSQEKMGLESNEKDIMSEEYQREWFLETPSYGTEKGPKVVQPALGKMPYVKPVELGWWSPMAI